MREMRRIFTLLELLLVVAVIVILMSMLLPGLRTAREMAKRISCSGNMKQLVFGCISYAGNNNDYLPPGKYGWSETDRRQSWMTYIASDVGVTLYTGSDTAQHSKRTIFYCPSDMTEWWINAASLSLYFFSKNSYSANYSVMDEIVQDGDNDGIIGPRKLSSIKNLAMYSTTYYPLNLF